MNRCSVLIFATIFTLLSQCQCTKRSGKEIRQFLLDTSNLAKEDFQSVTRSDLSDERDERSIRIQPSNFMNNKPRSLGNISQQQQKRFKVTLFKVFLSRMTWSCWWLTRMAASPWPAPTRASWPGLGSSMIIYSSKCSRDSAKVSDQVKFLLWLWENILRTGLSFEIFDRLRICHCISSLNIDNNTYNKNSKYLLSTIKF